MVTNKMDSNGPLLTNSRLIIGKCQPTNKLHVSQQYEENPVSMTTAHFNRILIIWNKTHR